MWALEGIGHLSQGLGDAYRVVFGIVFGIIFRIVFRVVLCQILREVNSREISWVS